MLGNSPITLPMFSFDFVMADPPWEWRTYSAKGEGKSPSSQYKTMTVAEIEALRIGDLVRPGGVLWLWCTWPMIDQQAALVAKWGMKVKTGGVWAKRTKTEKLRWGPGYLFRSVCEPFLLAALPDHDWKGPGITNMLETVENGVLDGLAREHSRKPDEAYALIEKITPGWDRADIFSRQTRAGWSSWGDEATKFDEVVA